MVMIVPGTAAEMADFKADSVVTVTLTAAAVTCDAAIPCDSFNVGGGSTLFFPQLEKAIASKIIARGVFITFGILRRVKNNYQGQISIIKWKWGCLFVQSLPASIAFARME
jgi:hypothetical protein